MRSLRREFLSVLSVLAIPAAVLVFFPYRAFSFRASSAPTECRASAAFVTLTPEQESAALVAARTSWQSDASARQRRHVRLPLGDLPDMSSVPLLKIAVPLEIQNEVSPLSYSPEAWKPSMRAPDPIRFEPEPALSPAPAFSREDLLKLK